MRNDDDINGNINEKSEWVRQQTKKKKRGEWGGISVPVPVCSVLRWPPPSAVDVVSTLLPTPHCTQAATTT